MSGYQAKAGAAPASLINPGVDLITGTVIGVVHIKRERGRAAHAYSSWHWMYVCVCVGKRQRLCVGISSSLYRGRSKVEQRLISGHESCRCNTDMAYLGLPLA